MSMQRIRRRYDVPAKRGMRVRYVADGKHPPEMGTITSSDGMRLRIRLDSQKRSYLFHPTWGLEYPKGKTA